MGSPLSEQMWRFDTGFAPNSASFRNAETNAHEAPESSSPWQLPYLHDFLLGPLNSRLGGPKLLFEEYNVVFFHVLLILGILCSLYGNTASTG